MTTVNSDPLLNVEEAAEYLATTVRNIRRMVSNRAIPHYKVGKFVRFKRSELDQFILRGRREAG